MAYYFDTTVTLSFDEAVARAVIALKSEGFGVIIDNPKLKEAAAQAGERLKRVIAGLQG